MSAVTIICSILIILVAIALIVVVLMQEGNKQGLGAIGGGAETFFGKNKAKSYEGKLLNLTKILIIVFIALALVMTIVVANENKKAAEEAAKVMMEDLAALTATVEPEAVDATAEPVVEATEEPVVEATVEATAEPTAEPTVEATVEPAE